MTLWVYKNTVYSLMILTASLTFSSIFISCEDDELNSSVTTIDQPNQANVNGSMGLFIDQPLDGQAFANTEVIVSGGHSNGGRVQVNGQDIIVTGGRFQTTLSLEEGAHQITVTDGVVQRQVNIIVDLTPPLVSISSPTQGLHVDQYERQAVTVSGMAQDTPSGIKRVLINDIEVPVEINAAFQYTFTPPFGLNKMVVQVEDHAGNASTAYRSFIYGSFRDWDIPLERAAFAFVSPFALDAISQAVISAVDGGLIEEVLMNGAIMSNDFTILDIQYTNLNVQISPENGYLDVEIEFEDLRIDFEVNRPRTRGDVYVSPARLTAQVYASATADGVLTAEVTNSMIQLDNFNLRVDNALIGALTTPLEGWLRGLAEGALLELLQGVLIDELIDPELFRPTLTFLNQEIGLHVILHEMDITRAGIEMSLGLGIDLENGGSRALGYLNQPEVAVPEPLPYMVTAALQENLLHMIFSKLWHGGLLNITLSEILDESPMALNAGLLNGLTGGQLTQYMEPMEIVGVTIRPSLPPISRFDPSRTDVVVFDLNDLLIDLKLPDGRVWATFGFNMEFTLYPSLVESAINLQVSLKSEGWLVDAPLFDFDGKRVLDVLIPLLEGIPNLLGPEGVNELFNLSELNLYGIRLESSGLQTSRRPNAYLRSGLQIIQ